MAKGTVCKTVIYRFNSGRRLKDPEQTLGFFLHGRREILCLSVMLVLVFPSTFKCPPKALADSLQCLHKAFASHLGESDKCFLEVGF